MPKIRRACSQVCACTLSVIELIEVQTKRLRLRQWKPADRAPLAALNADTRVMEFFPSTLTRAESDKMADRCQSLIEEQGWGPWAVESKVTQEFVGSSVCICLRGREKGAADWL